MELSELTEPFELWEPMLLPLVRQNGQQLNPKGQTEPTELMESTELTISY